MKFLRLLLSLVLVGVFCTAVSVAKNVKGNIAEKGITKGNTSVGTAQSIAPTEQSRIAEKFKARIKAEEESKSGLLPGKFPMRTPAQASASSQPQLVPMIPASSPPLAGGTYNVPSGTLPSLAYAANYITFAGIAGDVTLNLINTTYNETPIIFGAGNYTPAANSFSVTIKPDSAKTVTVNVSSSSSYGKGISFVGSNRITIDGNGLGGASLTVQNTAGSPFPAGDPDAAAIYISAGSDSITINKVTIHGTMDAGSIATATDARDGVNIQSGSAANTNIAITNCTISNGYIGLKAMNASSGTAALATKKLTVTGNDISGTGIGIAIDGAATCNTASNNVHNLTYTEDLFSGYTGNDVSATLPGSFRDNGFVSGIWFRGVDAASPLSKNIVDNFLISTVEAFGFTIYGIRTSGTAASLVTNNCITRIRSDFDSAGSIFAFRLATSAAYYNSVHLTGVTADGMLADGLRPSAGILENNASSNELNTGPDGLSLALDWAGSTSNHNALYTDPTYGFTTESGSLADHIVAASQDAASAEGNPFFVSATDCHINTATLSSAENIGDTAAAVVAAGGTDIDGNTRSALGPDAGADEFTLASAFNKEVFPVVINPPLAGGVPASLPVTPSVSVKNNRPNATGSFNLHLKISDGYDHIVSVSLNPLEVKSVAFPAWTPAAGTFTITAISELTGDQNTLNDTLARAQSVTAATVVVTDTVYNWNSDDQGWTRTNDFVRKSSFTKLGGPLQGASMVTERPNHTNTYTEGALGSTEGYPATYPGANLLISPWFDLSTMTGNNLYISFSHSISVEPGWDGSWMEYTVDGSNWHHLGQGSDPNGINWYSSSVYQNTPSFTGDPPDTVTLKRPAYNLFGPGTSVPTLPLTWWTSNGPPGLPDGPPEGDGIPQGPFGYVFAQLHISLGQYTPEIIHAPLVKFRYVAFSDAVNPPSVSAAADTISAFAGWAVDNFHVGKTPSVFSGDTISGTVFNDVNGNGVNNSEPAEAGVVVDLFYFGVHKDTTITNGSGAYSFNLNTSNAGLPGTYQVSVRKPGFAFTTPNPPLGVASLNAPGSGSHLFQNFGTYQGSVSGKKYNDLNNNGTFDGSDVGLAGFTITLHKDSCNGATLQTVVSDVNGNYQFVVLPGTYYLKETQQAPTYRQTEPAGNCTSVTVSGNSGSGTAVYTGRNFGNYKLNSVKIEKVNDLNGDGIKEAGDVTALPVGAIAVFDLKKNGSHVRFDTLGNGTLNKTALFDTGSYSYTESFTTAGWIRTLPVSATIPFSVTTGGVSQTITYMNFKMITLSGTKYEDKNGNGARDSGDVGLAGWTINVKDAGGLFFGGTSAVTDSNGNWSIDSVGGPKDTVTETSQAGWTQTTASPVVNAVSGTNASGLDIGNFRNITVSGVKYRDRNANHTREAGEEGLSGWTISITGTGAASETTLVGGGYSFSNVGPGSHTLSETPQAGWTTTQPIGGSYTFTPTSGVNQTTGRDFGNFKQSDSTALYRTFTSDEFEDGALHKKVKPAKPLKPFIQANLQTLMYDYFKQFGGTSEIKVGTAGVLNAGGKEKAYVFPKSYTDIFKSLNDKGITHSTDVDSTEVHRGFDVDNKGKQMLKRFKSLSPKKQRNDTFEELLVLSCNIALSDAGKTPVGLGSLIYNDGTAGAYNGMTVNQIMAVANNVMTNTDFVGLDVYTRLEEVAAKINDAFSCGGVDCETIQPFLAGQPGGYDSASWAGTAKVVVNGLYSVASVSYLKANPNAAPTTVPTSTPVPLPEVYALYQNYPNPFNPTTTVEFDLPNDASVSLKIYNILGQQVGSLFNHEILDAGSQSVDFDASALPSGVYFYRITAQSLNDDGVANGQIFTQVKKMMLIK
jgi:hypothetical protein